MSGSIDWKSVGAITGGALVGGLSTGVAEGLLPQGRSQLGRVAAAGSVSVVGALLGLIVRAMIQTGSVDVFSGFGQCSSASGITGDELLYVLVLAAVAGVAVSMVLSRQQKGSKLQRGLIAAAVVGVAILLGDTLASKYPVLCK